MPRRPSPLSLVCCVSTTLALFAIAGPARAQDGQRADLLPSDGSEAFQKKYSPHKLVFSTINKPVEGEKASKDSKEHRDAIDMTAQYYTYRLTWPSNTTPGEIDKLWGEFLREVNTADADPMRKGNPVFTEMLLKALALRARDVVQTKQQIAVVNAARMLARLARAGSDDAADACLEMIKNDKNFIEPAARLGAQYWALDGLGGWLGRTPDAGTTVAPGRAAREASYVEALVNVIEQFMAKDRTSAALPDDEMKGQQLFRREAVRALAQYRGPALLDAKGAVKVKSALTLLKVMNDDGLYPSARLDEQIEAAWGVARLQSKPVPDYRPDYAVQQVGYIVVLMAANARPPATGTKPGTGPRTGDIPWKVHAARLADALKMMQADVKDNPDKAAAAYVEKVLPQALRVLADLEVSERANGGDLKFWLSSNPVPDKSLYKSLPDATVNPLEKPDALEKPEPEKKPTEKKPDEKKPGDKKPDDKKPGKP
jgi:hypothetical protein